MTIKSSQNTATQNSRILSRLRWTIGTPYFVQGTKSLTEIPILFFIKFQLGMDDAGGQLFDALRGVGWMIKPIWGYISDRFALFGYHRKSWYVLMACLSVVFWFSAAIFSYMGFTIPSIYFIVFNLAFASYAFVDVVTDAIMVTEGQRLKRVGSFVNFQWLILSVANAIALSLGGWLQNNIKAGAVDLWVVFFLAGIPPLFTAMVGIRYAFLTALANTTNIVEDVVGAGLFKLFSGPSFDWLLDAFQGSMFEITNSLDTRTLILEMFIFISLFFTLLTIPFVELLKRDLRKQGIKIVLSKAD